LAPAKLLYELLYELFLEAMRNGASLNERSTRVFNDFPFFGSRSFALKFGC
jgi:hypothetical protein